MTKPSDPTVVSDTQGETKCDPCPFCGEEPEETHANDLSYFYVGCANEQCTVQPETGLESTEQKARDAWNWKPSPAASSEGCTDALIPEDGMDPVEAIRTIYDGCGAHGAQDSVFNMPFAILCKFNELRSSLSRAVMERDQLKGERDQARDALREAADDLVAYQFQPVARILRARRTIDGLLAPLSPVSPEGEK